MSLPAPPLGLGDLFSSPFFIIFLVIVVPLIAFSVYLRFTLRGRPVGRTAVTEAGSQPAVAVVGQPQQQRVDQGDSELAKTLGQVSSKIDRVESNLTKAMSTGLGDVMGELRALSQKLEDAVLAIKAAQSDAASPFNLPVAEEASVQRPPSDALKPNHVDTSVPVEHHPVHKELGDYDLGTLLEVCAVLEVLNYDRQQVEWLFELGLLSVDHMEIMGRIDQVLQKYGSDLKARDIADIVLRTNPPQAMFQEKARRVLRVLHELGDSDAGRSGQ